MKRLLIAVMFLIFILCSCESKIETKTNAPIENSYITLSEMIPKPEEILGNDVRMSVYQDDEIAYKIVIYDAGYDDFVAYRSALDLVGFVEKTVDLECYFTAYERTELFYVDMQYIEGDENKLMIAIFNANELEEYYEK